MVVQSKCPMKRTLHTGTHDRRRILSIPFELVGKLKTIDSKAAYMDATLPWSSGIVGSEFGSVHFSSQINALFAQLLDNSGRVAGPPFLVSASKESTSRLCIPLQDFQRIRFIVFRDSVEDAEITLVGKIFLASGGTTMPSRTSAKISKWRKIAHTFSPYPLK